MRKILSSQQIQSQAQVAIETFHGQIVQEVEDAIKKNDWVIVGMAQNPFVKKARRLLEGKGASFEYLEYGSYFSKWQQRLAIKIWTGWPTFPQVFHKGRLIGGFTDLQKYLESKN